ncbi:paraquat-inducible protein A [Advenella sp. WQ 585]|uniref:Paraquat-inducible protein A n=1 Tax=Advenella mandrilli TaxID=2800330 RepID=A0ABS1EG66_9BURK|nr:paraquat-inducible protein A [Advenella mandrilli]MBK1781495.1 paraquat-inducible protein A [Advenella mandrilli]
MLDSAIRLACHHCGQLHVKPQLHERQRASCVRCGTVLLQKGRFDVSAWLALSVAALWVFLIANIMPVATLSSTGMSRSATFLQSIQVTWGQGFPLVASMCLMVGFVVPLLQLSLLTWILSFLYKKKYPPGLRTFSRLTWLCKPWSMIPVFMLGVLVAVVKLAGMASLEPEAGLWAFAVLTFLLTFLNKLNSRKIWQLSQEQGVVNDLPTNPQAGQYVLDCEVCSQVTMSHQTTGRCNRCNASVHYRKPKYKSRTLALLAAAIVFYVPANLYPVMFIDSLLGSSGHTILGGVLQLWQLGSWDLALIVFVASIVVPISKIVIMLVLYLNDKSGSHAVQQQHTRLYQIVEYIGQWSMLDVFVVILLAALANFGNLMSVMPGHGATAFGLVVVFTMLSAQSFDIREGWDCVDDGIEQDDFEPAETAPTFQ